MAQLFIGYCCFDRQIKRFMTFLQCCPLSFKSVCYLQMVKYPEPGRKSTLNLWFSQNFLSYPINIIKVYNNEP